MHADCFFRMGATHAVCQDYASAGLADGVTHAILADGCSSSPLTDFGARFLVRAATHHIRLAANGSGLFPALTVTDAGHMVRAARLPPEALDATLLVATHAPGNPAISVFHAGDGVVAARRRSNGEFEFSSVEYSQNMPFYLRYGYDRDALARFEAARQSVAVRYGGHGWSELLPPMAPEPFRELAFETELYDLVLLLSDGAESFHANNGQPIELERVLAQIFDFKGFAGQFLGRRCGRFLSSFCAENGWKHDDDFTVAGIYVGDP